MKEEYRHLLTSKQYEFLTNQLDRLGEDWLSLVRNVLARSCLLYTSPSPRDRQKSRMPSSA